MPKTASVTKTYNLMMANEEIIRTDPKRIQTIELKDMNPERVEKKRKFLISYKYRDIEKFSAPYLQR